MDREDILLLVVRINQTWLSNPAEQFPALLGECFHEAMVIKGPDFQTMSSGRDACIRSYMDFVGEAKVTAWNLSDTEVDVSGDTAVATYAWKITYERNGQEHRERGHDLFVFVKAEGKWRAVWRAMLPSASG